MSRVTVTEKWTSEDDLRSVRRRVIAFLDDSGIEFTETEDGEIEAKQGSQLRTRLLGGWFVNARHLPKKMTIRFREADDGVQIRAKWEETLGFGIMDPMLKRKYESFFDEWLVDLRKAMR